MLLTWRLWRAIFHNNLQKSAFYAADWTRKLTISRTQYVLLGGVAVLVLILFPVSLVGGFVVLVLLSGTLSGWFSALDIARFIFREQEKRRYDLLSVSPLGRLGVHWTIVSRICQTQQVLRWLRQMLFGFFIIMAMLIGGQLMVALLTVCLWMTVSSSDTSLIQTLSLVWQLLLLTLIVSDFIFSVVSGVLVGIILPTYVPEQGENAAYSIATAGFLGVQLVWYIVYGGIAFWVMQYFVFPSIQQNAYLTPIVLTVIGLIVLIVCRESVVRALWRTAQKRLEFDAAESGIDI